MIDIHRYKNAANGLDIPLFSLRSEYTRIMIIVITERMAWITIGAHHLEGSSRSITL